jgi:hypothetical protein
LKGILESEYDHVKAQIDFENNEAVNKKKEAVKKSNKISMGKIRNIEKIVEKGEKSAYKKRAKLRRAERKEKEKLQEDYAEKEENDDEYNGNVNEDDSMKTPELLPVKRNVFIVESVFTPYSPRECKQTAKKSNKHSSVKSMLAKKRHNEKFRVEQMDDVGKLKAAINKDAVAFGEMLSKLLDMEICGVCGIEESPDKLVEISTVSDLLKNSELSKMREKLLKESLDDQFCCAYAEQVIEQIGKDGILEGAK